MGNRPLDDFIIMPKEEIDQETSETSEVAQPDDISSGGIIKQLPGEDYATYLKRIAERHPPIEPEDDKSPGF